MAHAAEGWIVRLIARADQSSEQRRQFRQMLRPLPFNGPRRTYMEPMSHRPLQLSRRSVIVSGAATAAALALVRSSPMPLKSASVAGGGALPPAAKPADMPISSLDPEIVRKALAALDRHAHAIRHHDRIAIADFSAPSSEPRLHFLDVASGNATRLLVAHGTGSDPGHTGFLHRFSNRTGSNASSEGAFVTGDYYVGKHGRSQRLVGLDPTNNNALDRAIVIHGAWYANAAMIAEHGKLGRSQGCFAVGESDLDEVFGFLGEGRLLYAAKV